MGNTQKYHKTPIREILQITRIANSLQDNDLAYLFLTISRL